MIRKVDFMLNLTSYRILAYLVFITCAGAYVQLIDRAPGITKRTIITRGTIIAAIITAPSLAAFFAGWLMLGDLIQAAIIGAVVHFVAMAFALKIIKKFFVGGAGQ